MNKKLFSLLCAGIFASTLMGSQAPVQKQYSEALMEKIKQEDADYRGQLRSQMQAIEHCVGAKPLSHAKLNRMALSLGALRDADKQFLVTVKGGKYFVDGISDSSDDEEPLGDIEQFKASLKPLHSINLPEDLKAISNKKQNGAAVLAPKKSNAIPITNVYAQKPKPAAAQSNFNDFLYEAQLATAALSFVFTDPQSGTSPVL